MMMNNWRENRIRHALEYVKQCAEHLTQQVESHPQSIPYLATLEEFIDFIQQVDEWTDRLSPEKSHDIIMPVVMHINRMIQDVDDKQIDFTTFHRLLSQALIQLGPETVISHDSMNLCVNLPAEIASLWTPAGLVESMQGMGIKFGYEKEHIKSLFAEKKFDRLYRIVHGKEPVPGTNASLVHCLKIHPLDVTRKEHSYPVFTWVSKGETVLKRNPPGMGEKGRNIYGEEILAQKGSDVILPTVEHCAISKDGFSLQSTVDGCAYYENQSLHIVPAKHIEDDIHADQGELNFNTAVLVDGDIHNQCVIHSSGDVAVCGMIEDAQISAGGSFFCQGGVIGTGWANIHAGRDFYAKSVQKAQIEAGRIIRVDGVLNQTQAQARRIYVDGKQGQIVGGEVRALFDIFTQVLGSKEGVRTKVVIHKQRVELQAEIDRLTFAIREKKAQQKKLFDQKKSLTQASNTKDKQKKLQQFIAIVSQEIKSLQSTLDHYKQDLAETETGHPFICAQHEIFPNTVIQIYDKTMTVNKKLGPSIIMFMDGKLIVEPYQDSMMNRRR